MNNALLQIIRVLLVSSLALYGPVAMAGERANGAVYATEICADGVLETLYVDANGAPAEPHGSCLDCQVCCHVSVASANGATGANLVLRLIDVPDDPSVFRVFHTRKHMFRCMPRGPPVALHVRATTVPVIGNGGCGSERSLSEDATA